MATKEVLLKALETEKAGSRKAHEMVQDFHLI